MTGSHRNDVTGTRVAVLIPVLNDWDACVQVVGALDRELGRAGRTARVLVVDDGSTDMAPAFAVGSGGVEEVEILRLRRNLGHQRAIGVALAWIEQHRRCAAVVVMDGDGEDDPADVPRLLDHFDALGGTHIVFAERTRRSESLVFRVSYAAFKLIHRILTGRGVRVGNFSVFPYARLRALVSVPDLWNHYAAAVFISRLPFTSVPTHRARRLSGRSSMNFPALVSHGLSAISVFSEIVSVRVLLATLGSIALTLAGMIAVLAIRFFTERAIPGWATFTTGILLMLLVQSIMFSILFSFTVLANRKSASVILARDYDLFVDDVEKARTAQTPLSQVTPA
jgi:polyisoprenyl-phosphate glycosyltransferase